MSGLSPAVRWILATFPGSMVICAGPTPARPQEGVTMSLLDDLNIDYTQWRPHDQPDQPRGIEGIVKDRQVWESGFGPFDMLFVVTDDGTAWSWAALGAIAAREVGRRDPQPGDRMAVAYKGDIENKVGDKPMHVFRVLTEHGPRHSVSYRPPETIQAPAAQQDLDLEPF